MGDTTNCLAVVDRSRCWFGIEVVPPGVGVGPASVLGSAWESELLSELVSALVSAPVPGRRLPDVVGLGVQEADDVVAIARGDGAGCGDGINVVATRRGVLLDDVEG